MLRSLASVAVALLPVALPGCVSWQDIDALVVNDGPATVVEVVLDHEDHFPEDVVETKRFTYAVGTRENVTDRWRIEDGRYWVTVTAGDLRWRQQERFCASHSVVIWVNATDVQFEQRGQGDGFTGC